MLITCDAAIKCLAANRVYTTDYIQLYRRSQSIRDGKEFAEGREADAPTGVCQDNLQRLLAKLGEPLPARSAWRAWWVRLGDQHDRPDLRNTACYRRSDCRPFRTKRKTIACILDICAKEDAVII